MTTWNAQVLFLSGIFGLLVFRTLARLYISWKTFFALTRGYRGISFVPRASVEVRDMVGLSSKHQNEFVRLVQKAPEAYLIETVLVSLHVDFVRCVGTNVDVHLIGSGTCQVFYDVHDLATVTSRIPAETFTCTESGVFSFVKPPDSIAVVVCQIVGGSEITVGTQQWLIEGARVVSIKGVFNENECFVCYDRKVNTVILPCRHSSICTGCIAQLREPKCVVCRGHFTQYLAL